MHLAVAHSGLMSDELTPDERELCALTLDELKLKIAHQDALIARDRFALGGSTVGATRAAEILDLHWTRIYQMRRDWSRRSAKWKDERKRLVCRIAELSEK